MNGVFKQNAIFIFILVQWSTKWQREAQSISLCCMQSRFAGNGPGTCPGCPAGLASIPRHHRLHRPAPTCSLALANWTNRHLSGSRVHLSTGSRGLNLIYKGWWVRFECTMYLCQALFNPARFNQAGVRIVPITGKLCQYRCRILDGWKLLPAFELKLVICWLT